MTRAGFAVWVTGPACASVEAIAADLAGRLAAREVAVELLAPRTPGIDALPEAARAVPFVAGMLVRHGIAVVVALPATRAERDRARADIGRLIEVHVAPAEDSPAAGYEPPERAEVEVAVPEPSPGAGVERTLRSLELLGLLASVDDRAYSEQEEREVIRRLKAFGYL